MLETKKIEAARTIRYEDCLWPAFEKQKFTLKEIDGGFEKGSFQDFSPEEQDELLITKILDMDEDYLIDCVINNFDYFKDAVKELVIKGLENKEVHDYVESCIEGDIEKLDDEFDPDEIRAQFNADLYGRED